MSRPDLVAEIALIPEHRRSGRITGVMGMRLDAGGLLQRLGMGRQCSMLARDGRRLACVAVGFRAGLRDRGRDGHTPTVFGELPERRQRADLASGYAQLAALPAAPR